MTQFYYPIHILVDYDTDKEYRQCVRHVFQMTSNTEVRTNDELDEISKDEMDYDEAAFDHFLKEVYQHTRNNDDLMELYKMAAATFFSTDEDIGLTVLLSYDYFKHFHQCLCFFFAKKRGEAAAAATDACDEKGEPAQTDMTSHSQYNYLCSIFRK